MEFWTAMAVVERLGSHQAQHRAEAFGSGKPRAGPHPEADARSPSLLAEAPRLDQPLLAVVEAGERPQQLAVGLVDGGTHGSGDIGADADLEAGNRVGELAAEAGRVVGVAHTDGQAGRRALLARVTERRRRQVGHGQIDVGVGCYHHGVLARSLRKQAHFRLPRQKQPGRVIGPGEDHGVHTRVGHQMAAHTVVGSSNEPDQALGQARGPAALGHDLRAPGRLGRRLQDGGIARSQRREHPTGGNRHREVPRRHHQHGSQRLEPSQTGTGQLRAGQAGTGQLRAGQTEGPLPVPAGEVDGLRYLRVGLGDGLVALVHHGRHQVAPAASELTGHPPQQVPALGGSIGRPNPAAPGRRRSPPGPRRQSSR